MKAVVDINSHSFKEKTKEFIEDFTIEDLVRLLKKHYSFSICLECRGREDDLLDYFCEEFKEKLTVGEEYLSIST